MPPFLAESTEATTTPEIVTVEVLDSSQEIDETATASPEQTNHSEQQRTEVTVNETPTEEIPSKCIYPGCSNPPREDEQWEGEFCCNDCAVKYCHVVFKTWVQKQGNPQEI